MKQAHVELESISPYSQSRYIETEKLKGELPDDFEKRTWRDRCHVDGNDHIVIPPMAFKNSIGEAAKFLGRKIAGKGHATWTKHFEAGIIVTEGIVLPCQKATVEGEWLLMNSDGVPGSGKRVKRCFPLIRNWKGSMTFYIIDDLITEDVFRDHLDTAGSLIGIGRFRPRNRGFYGRFKVNALKWNNGEA